MRAAAEGKKQTSFDLLSPLSHPNALKNLPHHQLALLAGASYGGHKLRVSVRAAQREQGALCAEAGLIGRLRWFDASDPGMRGYPQSLRPIRSV